VRRDLAVVLNGQTEKSELVFTNGHTTLLLPRADPSAPPKAGPPTATSLTDAVRIPQGGRNSVSAVGLVSVQHLCEQVDCNKPLFGK
jgi:hypothetical protein